MVLFCNLILFQARENKDTQTIVDNKMSLTKQLSKNFLAKKDIKL